MPVYPHDCRKGSLAFCPTESGIMGGLKSGELKTSTVPTKPRRLAGRPCIAGSSQGKKKQPKTSFSRSVWSWSYLTEPHTDWTLNTRVVCWQWWKRKGRVGTQTDQNKGIMQLNILFESRFGVFLGLSLTGKRLTSNHYSCFHSTLSDLFCKIPGFPDLNWGNFQIKRSKELGQH